MIKYGTIENNALKEIHVSEIDKFKDDDKIFVFKDNPSGVTDEVIKAIDACPPGRIFCAKHEGFKYELPSAFTLPFAGNVGDIKPLIEHTTNYKTDEWIYNDMVYSVSTLKKLTLICDAWTSMVPIIDTSKQAKEYLSDEKEFIRTWKESARIHKGSNGVITSPIYSTSTDLIILTHNDGEILYDLLDKYESYFENVVILDDMSKDIDKLTSELKRYRNDNPSIINGKIQIYQKELNKDFGTHRNFAVSMCKSDWVFHLDSDESLSSELINNLQRTVENLTVTNKIGVAFPRLNYLNGVLVNDIPRDKWTVEHLKKLKDNNKGPTDFETYFDFQGRLHRRHIKWVRKVHEMIEPLYLGLSGDRTQIGKLVIFGDKMGIRMHIVHDKKLTRQTEQDNFYDEILDEDKKVLFDSVMYTNEGISKHAREEAKQLNKNGWNLFLTDLYKSGFGEEFKDMYKPFDMKYDNYITYVNQPPHRNGVGMDLAVRRGSKNLVYFLAWEGDCLPLNWLDVIKSAGCKKILTPSNYCKEVFEKEGLQNVEVLPHGIDPELFKPKDKGERTIVKDDNKMAFLFAGTWHGGKEDRKGMDIILKAWNEVKDQLPDWKLVLKLNPIYFQKEFGWSHNMRNISGGDNRIEIIDDSLTDEEMAQLYNECDCYLFPSRSEGFGITALEARACGLPIIATDATGHTDFLNKDNSRMIKVLRKKPAERRFPYAGRLEDGRSWHANWIEPSKNSLKEHMMDCAHNINEESIQAVKHSEEIRDKYSWENITTQLEEIFKDVLK